VIISRTPFRISFFGGGTDFPEFYSEHGGATLLTAIDKYCYLSVHRMGRFFKHVFRASYAQTELVQHPSEFKHPLIREALLHLDFSDGLEITHVADLPGRTGLGSSSSFTVGLLHALHAFRGDAVTPAQLARESIEVERVRVGDAGGHQDQYAAAFGGLIRVDFRAGPEVKVTPLRLSAGRLRDLQDRVLMFYTGVEKSADVILREQSRRVARNTPALIEMLNMVDAAEKILTGDDSLDGFGRLLHESWQRKRSLSPGISNGVVDDAYEAAIAAGALGGKLLGAGGRGFLLVFAPPDRHASVRERLSGLQEVPVSLGAEGSRIIFQSAER
jgi:D-glycero-alpha-D-manno-heptose-7-phosphate kinase